MDRDFNLTKKPVTPLVGADVFIPDSESRVFSSNGLIMVFGAPRGGGLRIWEKPLKNTEFGKF